MESEKQEKKMSAKPVSLKGQIVAVTWIAGWSAYKFIKAGSNIDIYDIVASGLSMVACFSPVYVSIILDKIKEINKK